MDFPLTAFGAGTGLYRAGDTIIVENATTSHKVSGLLLAYGRTVDVCNYNDCDFDQKFNRITITVEDIEEILPHCQTCLIPSQQTFRLILILHSEPEKEGE